MKKTSPRPGPIIDALGGPSAAERKIGADHSTLIRWRDQGYMTRPWPKLLRLMVQTGELDIDPILLVDQPQK
jgi:hypothetical protein